MSSLITFIKTKQLNKFYKHFYPLKQINDITNRNSKIINNLWKINKTYNHNLKQINSRKSPHYLSQLSRKSAFSPQTPKLGKTAPSTFKIVHLTSLTLL
jgi:hypothetical protein